MYGLKCCKAVVSVFRASLLAQMEKNPHANTGDHRFDPWVGKMPWRRA